MDRLARHYDRISWAYDLLDWPFEQLRYRKLRPILCGDLGGKVLEVGVGTGRNLAYYPEGARVTGIDASRAQLRRAQRRAASAKCAVKLARMDVTQMAFEDESFDACVATFLFCVLPDEFQLPALSEILRVVRPGAPIRLLEYVYSKNALRRSWMKILSPYVQFVFSARFDRTTREAISLSGARVASERFVYADTVKLFELTRPAD